MPSIRVGGTLRSVVLLLGFGCEVVASAGQGVRDVKASADKGSFQQAWAQSRAVLASTPSADDLSTLKTLFRKYPRIQESGVTATSSLIDAARTEEDLLRAEAEVGFLAKCVKLSLCDPAALAQLQTRFMAAASTLVFDTGISVTFESNLLAEWAASTGSDLNEDLERRVYQNTSAQCPWG